MNLINTSDIVNCNDAPGKDAGNAGAPENAGGKGSLPLTVTNARGIPVPAMPGVHGGKLKRGNDVNQNMGGRPPDRIRVRATEGVEELLPMIVASTKLQARIANSKDAKLTPDARGRAHAEAIRGFRGLVEAGPGSRTTMTLENAATLDVFASAMDRAGICNEQQVQVLEDVKSYLKPS